MGVTPDVRVLHLEVLGAYHLLRGVFGFITREENAVVDCRAEGLARPRDHLRMYD